MSNGKSRTGMYIAIAVIVIIIVVAGAAIALLYKPAASNNGTPLTLFAGEVSSASYGFGNTATSIATAPNAPTLQLKEGQSYTMTVTNSGTMPHAWEITRDKTTSTVLFGAKIAPTSFLATGASGSVTFTPNEAGTFYYICPVPGHVALGMWGTVIVTA
jgi:uncharacterized cupredoxin-like copper-binding protein